MAINFPDYVDSFTNPSGNDTLQSISHATQHSDGNDSVTALEKFLLARDTGASGDPIAVGAGRWPLTPLTPTPAEGDFTWVNQGTGVNLAVTATPFNGLSMFRDGDATGVSALVRDIPGTEYTVTALVAPLLIPRSNAGVGLCWRDSSTGELITFGVYGDSTDGIGFAVKKWDDPTTWNSSYNWQPVSLGSSLLLRVQETSSERIASISYDGTTFVAIHTVSNADFLEADEIGFFVDPWQASAPRYDVGLTVLSWEEVDDTA